MNKGRRRYGRRRPAAFGVVAGLLLLVLGVVLPTSSGAATGTVLILESTVSGGVDSPEADAAEALGYTVEIVDDAAWASMTAAQFDDYEVIILGDPTCGFGTEDDAAEANAETWGSAVTGNVIVIGSDPTFHVFLPGVQTLISKGIEFAGAAATTGAYITLSCYYDGSLLEEAVPVLVGFTSTADGFKVQSSGCNNDVHITATHPGLAGLTDEALSDWSCSTHESFTAFPSDFEALAMAVTPDGTYTAPDGTVGFPYILARGSGLSTSNISLNPATATLQAGTNHTLTATILIGGTPVAGETVTFTVASGPNAGTTGSAVTDANGQASFTYTSASAGTDTVRASFVDDGNATQLSNDAIVNWTPAPTTTTTAPTTTTTAPTTTTTAPTTTTTAPTTTTTAPTTTTTAPTTTTTAPTTTTTAPTTTTTAPTTTTTAPTTTTTAPTTTTTAPTTTTTAPTTTTTAPTTTTTAPTTTTTAPTTTTTAPTTTTTAPTTTTTAPTTTTTCKPGHGYGDSQRCHSGPPGRPRLISTVLSDRNGALLFMGTVVIVSSLVLGGAGPRRRRS